MDGVVNHEQAVAWNGYEGDHWATHRSRYDAVNQAFNAPILDAAAITQESRIVDVGCGTGQLTRAAAQLAARSEALGVDLSMPMLRRARATAASEGLDNVSFVRGDAQVHAFPTGRFDVAVSRFGVMFFTDPVAAFRNIGRALRTDGRLALASLRSPEQHDLAKVLQAVMRLLPTQEPPSNGPGPYSLADPSVIRQLLTTAGYERISVAPVDAPQRWGTDARDAARFFIGWGPVRHRLLHVDPALRRLAFEAAMEVLRDFEGEGGVQLRGAAWLTRATRP